MVYQGVYLGKRIKGKRTQNQWSQTKQCQDQNFDNKTSASAKAFKGKKILGTIEILKYNPDEFIKKNI